MLYEGEAWYLNESEMGILQRTERSMVREMCEVQLKDRKRCMDLMFLLGLDEAIDHLAMTNRDHWYGHVLRREDGLVLIRALDFEVEGQGKNGRLMRILKLQVEEEIAKVSL